MSEDKYISDFKKWCSREHIKVTPNEDIFFVSARKTIKPLFKLGTNVFIHFVDKMDSNNDDMYMAFAQSFNTIVIIRKDVVHDLFKHFSKQEICEHFNVNL